LLLCSSPGEALPREITSSIVWKSLMKRSILLAPLLACLGAPMAQAHMSAKPIELWGPFLPDTVTCLRRMSRATHACFATVLDLEIRCRDALLRGEGCDREQLENAADDATRAVRMAVVEACTEGQLTEIGYFGFADVDNDLSNACVTQTRAAVEATYVPAAASGVSQATAACLTASSAYGNKVMLAALERQTPVMERMTARLFAPEDKSEAVRRMRLELSDTRQRWIAGLLEVCPSFADIYGRSAESFLRTLGQRVDCVLSKTYVNSAVTCLAQVCGNGIAETPEECDDGDADDGDSCRSNCTSNPAPLR
jgi:cysteine-rich repeat protein